MSVVFLYLRITHFGSRLDYDALLNVCVMGGGDVRVRLASVLDRHCQRSVLTGDRGMGSSGTDAELSYRLVLRDPARHAELRADLLTHSDLSRVNLSLHADDVEA